MTTFNKNSSQEGQEEVQELFNTAQQKEMEVVADYISYLSLMMITKANSGHPGMPLGCARLYTLLRGHFINSNPSANSGNANTNSGNANIALQDRLVLSAGHGSALLYAGGYFFDDVFTVADLASFRSLHSHTPGHPELDAAKGIYTTTGPLGQGFANGVGMALEARMLRSRAAEAGIKNANGEDFFTSNVFVIFGDGCMMEGLTTESAALAAKLGLGNFIALYDDNAITIDGNVSLASCEDVRAKFEALGFITATADGNNFLAMANALQQLISGNANKPKLLITKTVIGKGLPAAGTSGVHGAPASEEDIALWVKGSTLLPCFSSEETVLKNVKQQLQSGEFLSVKSFAGYFPKVAQWKDAFFAEQQKFSNNVLQAYTVATQNGQGAQFAKSYSQQQKVNEVLQKELCQYRLSKPTAATRAISEEVLLLISKFQQNLVGGSADLVASTKAHIKGAKVLTASDYSGRNIAYGVREHAMGAVGNGLALGGNFVPFSSTFLVFSDYMRPTIRLAALMQLQHAFIFTHDSYCVGEDGPTHQPVEHISSLRLMPGLDVYRPATDREVALCYLSFLQNKNPAVFSLTRQSLHADVLQHGLSFHDEDLRKKVLSGGYVFYESHSQSEKNSEIIPEIIFMASGFELGLAYNVALFFEKQGKKVRVISVPCFEKFIQKEDFSQLCGIANNIPCVFIEPYALGPYKHLMHSNFMVKSLEDYGKSASQESLEKFLGFDEQTLIGVVSKSYF